MRRHGWDWKLCSCFAKQYDNVFKMYVYNMTQHFLIHKVYVHTFLHREVFRNALSNIIRNSLKQEVIQMSIMWWMGRQMVVRFSSVQFSCSVLSNFLQPHGLHHARLPCPSLSLGACSDSYLLSHWCHPTISSFVAPFSSYLQCFPASASFLWSQLFASGDQSIGTSASVLPMNIQGWFSLGLTVHEIS